jgi:hypothetical protein
MKEYGGMDPRFLGLGTIWGLAVYFMPLPLYPLGKSPRYSLDRRLDGPQCLSGRYGKVKILDRTGTKTPTPRSFSP